MDLKNFFVAVVACSLFACVVAGELTTAADPTPSPTPSSSTDPSSTTSSTTVPTFPPTTTPSPTTTAPPETTTTPAPSTSPAPAPTPTPAPVPSDGRGNWTVSNDSVTCIMAQMVVSAKIMYPLETVNKTGTAEVKVPASAKATGVCDPSHQNVQISWDKNTLELNFQKNDTTKVYFINLITLSVVADKETFPNISSELVGTTFTLERKLMEFKTNLNESYRCTREESLPLHKPNSTNNDGVLVLNKVQLQAFHDKAVPVFGNAQDCELDTPDIVPIAVGCALAALVFVVLIAYLVGRRRSQARGYLSM